MKRVNMIVSGKQVPFKDVNIGHPFWAHDRMWVRTSYDGACELAPSTEHSSCCNFTIDECDKVVGEVTIGAPYDAD